MTIHVRALTGADEAEAATLLLAQVWGTAYESSPIPGDVVLAVSAWGGCVLGAFDGDDLVGVTVGIAAGPHSATLASLIAGVRPAAVGTGVGRALKAAQREWAVARGVTTIEWTYDPLVRRNAHFNINRLGAGIAGYHVEHYPPIPDAINGDDPTDRLLARWDVATAAPREPAAGHGAVVVLDEGPDGRPRLHDRRDGDVWLVGTPPDIEALRRTDPAAGFAWRLATREVFLAAGDRRVTGFTEDGSYVLATGTSA